MLELSRDLSFGDEAFAIKLITRELTIEAWDTPDPCPGFRPRLVDRRLPLVNATAGEGKLVMRAGRKLYVAG